MLFVLVLGTAFELGNALPDASLVTAARASPVTGPSNPATLALLPGFRCSLNHCTLYGLKELAFDWAGLDLGRPAPMNLSLSNLGVGPYREQSLRFGIAPVANLNLAAGIALELKSVSVTGYGRDFAPTVDAGILYHRPRFATGFYATNLNRARLRSGTYLPASYVFGVWGEPEAHLGLGLDFVKGADEHWVAGAEFRLSSAATLRLGIETRPLLYALGLDLCFLKLRLSYSCRVHPALGLSHVLGVGFGK